MNEEVCGNCGHLKLLHLPGTGCTTENCPCGRAGMPSELYHEPGRKNSFKPGNPGGPPGVLRKRASVKRLFVRLMEECEADVYEQVKRLATKIDDDRTKAQFIRFVCEQLDGRAVESVKLMGADGGPVETYDLSKLDAGDLRRVLDVLRSARRADDPADDPAGRPPGPPTDGPDENP